MINNNTIQKYKDINNKIKELHKLLADKLYKFEIINEEEKTLSFTTLLLKVTPISMESIVVNTMSTPVPSPKQRFTSEEQITNYFNAKPKLSQANLLLVEKFLFYYRYLAYRLEEMNVSKKEINNARTLKALILLLDKVKRQKRTYIHYNSDADNIVRIYANYNTPIIINVYDEDGNIVTDGRIKINYPNNNTYYPLSTPINFFLPKRDNDYEYTIEYDNQNSIKYKPSSTNIIIKPIDIPLIGKIEMNNTSSNIVYKSDDPIAKGYNTDIWTIKVDIQNEDNTLISVPTPFKMYLCSKDKEEYFIGEGITNNKGVKIFNNIVIDHYTSDVLGWDCNKNPDFYDDFGNDDDDSYMRLCIKTNFNDDRDKVIASRRLDINHKPIKVINNNDDGIYYMTDCLIPNEITLQYVDQRTGCPIKEIDDDYYVKINDLPYKCLAEKNYKNEHIVDEYTPIQYDITTIPKHYGKNIVHIVLARKSTFFNHNLIKDKNLTSLSQTEQNQLQEQLNSLNNEDAIILFETDICIMEIKSNFELPEQTSYFLNDTPIIYYKPLGAIGKNKQAYVNGTIYSTNAQGILHKIANNKTPGTHTLLLKANSPCSDSCSNGTKKLTEEVTFEYELKKPFDIELISLNKNKEAKYKIIIYDMDNYSIDNVKVYNDNNEECFYNYVLEGNILTVTIKRKNVGPGIKKLDVTINDYHEQQEFEFYEQIFTLQQEEVRLGENKTIIFQTNDSDIDISNITLTGNGLKNNFIATKENNIITFKGTVIQAYPQGTLITITVSDEEGIYISETFTIKIPKEDLTNYITTEDSANVYMLPDDDSDEIFYSPQFLMKSKKRPTEETLIFTFKDGYPGHRPQNKEQKYNETSISFDIDKENKMTQVGTYTASLIFHGSENSNYNDLETTFVYRIASNTEYIQEITLDTNNNLNISTIERDSIENITKLVSDLDIVGCKLFVVYEKVRNKNDNFDGIIRDVNLINDEIEYKRKNEEIQYAFDVSISNDGSKITILHKNIKEITQEELVTNLEIINNGEILKITYEDDKHTYEDDTTDIVKNVHEGTDEYPIIYQQ